MKIIKLNLNSLNNLLKRCLNYQQGQSPEPNIREYFYYIDHQGMLFLDDARMKNFTSCFKEKKFLQFFFKRLQLNKTGKYQQEFPYLSLCGKERNFIRCDDLPIVFTHLKKLTSGEDILTYGHADDLLKYSFQPEQLFMQPKTGRVYHPAMEKVGGIGLVRSALAIELSKQFIYRDDNHDLQPTHFLHDGKQYELTNCLAKLLPQ